ncbi:MAG: right-handed parallel beta-helix repeat-containing protein, partial [Saprospiraceae bacterium]
MPALHAQNCLPGGITFTTQAEVDAFPTNYPGCTQITGDVTINDGDYNAFITNLNGLSNITSIGGNLRAFLGCDGLTNLNGLNNLTTIGGRLEIFDCDALISLNGLNNLTSIGGRMDIHGSDALVNLSGLDNLLSVGGICQVHSNDAQTSMEGLSSLTSIGGDFDIYDNPLLTNLDGITSLTTIGDGLAIFLNPLLSVCNAQSICDYLDNPANPASIHDNAPGCNTRIEVETTCANPDCPLHLVLTSQAEVDAFALNYPNCTMMSGNVTINDGDFSANITNLNGLSNLTSIGGSLRLSLGCDGLTDLSGLNNLTTIDVDLFIFDCDALINLNGLNNLTSIGRELDIYSSDALVNFTGLDNLLTIGEDAEIHSNDVMTSLDGFVSLHSVGGRISLYDNALLTNLDGFGALTTIEDNISIFDNATLTNLNGLINVTSLVDNIYLSNNAALTSLTGLDNLGQIVSLIILDSPNLSDCNVPSICDYLANPANPASISGNATGCNTRVEVDAACDALPDIRYVRQGGSGTGDGFSWANASADLQAMINASAAGDQVWVAAGTYKPTTSTSRNICFSMGNGVTIYGGFPGTGNPDMGDRDWVTYTAILSGDIGTANVDSDNSFVVIKAQNLNSTAVLDGFLITKASGIGGMLHENSANMVTNCSFSDNQGSGMKNENSTTAVTNCSFSGNDGSGMYNDDSAPVVANCEFSNNSGSGMYNDDASSTLTDCTFTDNSATSGGGIVHYGNSMLTLTN